MYEIIRNVIKSRNFELSDMLKQIKKNCLRGDITEEQETELILFARENAEPENSYEGAQKQIDDLRTYVDSLTETVKNNTNEILKLKGEQPVPDPEPEEYPEYKQPTGAHDAYHKDDKITYKGKKYICIAPEGTAVVWSPGEYPAYWQMAE